MDDKFNIQEQIRQYISKASLSENGVVKDDTLIFDQGLLDSMGLLYLVEFIKEAFDVEPADNELIKENFDSINSISLFVINKFASKKTKR